MFVRLRKFIKFLYSLTCTNIRLLRGMWKLTKLPQPAITFFGSARTSIDSPAAQSALQLAKQLTLKGYSIITGVGPGIMEAANRGAYEAVQRQGYKAKKYSHRMSSLGIGLTRLSTEENSKKYVHEYITMEHFFARKWLLVRYAAGFIIFPGGYGTLDEMFEVVTLIQCERTPQVPIVLFGKEYWKPLEELIYRRFLEEGMITDKELSIITLITDDIDEAVKTILSSSDCHPKK